MKDDDLIERYHPADRANHWLTAITFILLAASGLALFHPAFFFLSHLFGGGPWMRILHPFIGVVMAVSFYFLAHRFFADNFMTAADWQWVRQLRDVITNHDERLPEVGRFNAGQKLLFWVMIATLLLLLLSGIGCHMTMPLSRSSKSVAIMTQNSNFWPALKRPTSGNLSS